MEGLIGLTQNINRTESAMRDLSILERMDQRIQQDKQAELAAQQQQEMIMERAYQMADQLLEKDRKRINKRIRMAQNIIANGLRDSGGSRANFMAEGGLSIINNITNDVMRSDEAIRYQENKMNLAKIYEAQDKGLGDQINPKDLASLKAYRNNEEGAKITYSGLMNKIDMPPASDYDEGYIVTPREIMMHEKNFSKLFQDYNAYYSDQPDKQIDINDPLINEKIEAYVKMRGYSVRGNNKFKQQLAAQYNKGKNNNTTTTKQKNSIIAKMYETQAKTNGLTYEQLMFEHAGDPFKTMRKNADGTTNVAVNQYFGNKSSITGKQKTYSNEVTVSDFLLKGWTDSIGNTLEGTTVGDFAGQFFPDGKIGNPITQGVRKYGIGDNNYGVSGSYTILPGFETKIASAFFNEENGYQIQGGKIIDFVPDDNDFTAAGFKLKNKILTKKDGLKNNYKIEGVITGFLGKDNSGQEQLITHIVDKNGNINVDKSKNIIEGNMGVNGSDQLRSSNFIALRNEETGDLFYKEVDLSKESVRKLIEQKLGDLDDSSSIVEADNTITAMRNYQKQMSVIEAEQNTNALKTIEPIFKNSNFEIESSQFVAPGSAGSINRNDLIKSFYTSLNFNYNKAKNNVSNEGYLTISDIENPQFSKSLLAFIENQEFTNAAAIGSITDALSDFTNYKNPYAIIDEWLNNVTASTKNTGEKDEYLRIAEEWKRHLTIYEMNK